MKLLLDTHIILWTLDDSSKLSEWAKDLNMDASNDVYCGLQHGNDGY